MKNKKIYDKKERIIIARNTKELKQGIEEALPDALKQIDTFFSKHETTRKKETK